MKVLIVFFTLIIFLSCSENKSNNNPLLFELRIAESEANPNLIEMIMDKTDLKFYVHDSVFIKNKDIKSTDVFDWETHPKVMVILTDEGRKKFTVFTQQNIGKNAAILLDNKLVSAPRINAEIPEGKLIIIGHFSHEEALRIAEGILP